MSKLVRFSPFTTSQNSVLNSYISIVGISSSGKYIRTVPSYRRSGNNYSPKENPLEDLPDVINSWTETGRQLLREWNSDRIKEITEIIKGALDEGTGEAVTYEINFHIDWDGEIHLDSVLPDGYPTIGEKSSYIGTYTEKITVRTEDPRNVFSELTNLKNEVNKRMNISIKTEKDRKDFAERVLKEHNEKLSKGEYKDPPTRERLTEIGRMA